jgi:hypothetical protein
VACQTADRVRAAGAALALEAALARVAAAEADGRADALPTAHRGLAQRIDTALTPPRCGDYARPGFNPLSREHREAAMTTSMPVRTPTAPLIAILALAQAALGVFRALGWFHIGGDLMGRGVLIMPVVGAVAFARGVVIAGATLLYVLFAGALLTGRPAARPIGLIAAAVNLLLALSLLIQGEGIMRGLLWCLVPAIVVWYLLAQPRAASDRLR